MSRFEPVVEEDNPLWMPKGSVRSLMALAVLGVTLVMWVTQMAVSQEQALLTAGVVGAYFIERNSAARATEAKAVERKVDQTLDAVNLLKATVAPDGPPQWARGGQR